MVSESYFLSSLSDPQRKLYLENEFSEDLENVLLNNFTVRQNQTFKQIQVSTLPRFLENMLNSEQIARFRTFVEQEKFGVTDSWCQNLHVFDKYNVWKKKYLKSRGITQKQPASLISSPTNGIQKVQQRQLVTLSITFPAKVGSYLRGKNDVTLNRICATSGTTVQIQTGLPNSQAIISSTSHEKAINACKLIWDVLGYHQRTVYNDNDIELFKFFMIWSPENKMQFQNQYKSSLRWTYSNQKYIINVRSWTKTENKVAVQKLKELLENLQLPPKLFVEPIARKTSATVQPPELDHLPNCTNILILGETGVGKSTFINGMVNYLRFNKIEKAEKYGPDVLVSSRFTLYDENHEEFPVAVKPEHGNWDKNEATEEGASATQKPVSYTFAIPGRQEKYIRIIDTPGIGDTRGINQDERNFEEIMSHIADYPKIHAIIFLVAPSVARLTVSFRYGIQELLARLHRTAVDNVVFCFTKSRPNQFKAGESFATLQKLLKDLGKSGIDVPLNRDTSFFFDSESFRYLAAKKQGFKFGDEEHRDYKESWQKSVCETQRLFKYIFTLQPHNVNETLCVNNTKKVIQMLSKPLGEITKNILTNESLLKDKKKEVEQMAAAGDDLQSKLFVEQITLEAEELANPQTVCTAQSCVEHGTVGGKPHTTIYKTVCDPDCGHTGIQTELLPNPQLADCKAFENEICKKCKCRWELHMHIRSKTNEVTVTVIDDAVQQDLNTTLTKQEDAKSFMEFLERKIQDQNAHKESILKHCAEFAAFVAQNSMLAVNDAYNEYLKYLIKEEKDKENSDDSAILAELEIYANAYEEQSKVLIKAGLEKRNQQKTVDEINKMINDLKETDFCGRFLEEIQYLQVVSVRVSAQNRSNKIVLTNWKEDLKWLMEKPIKKVKKFLH